VARTIEEFLFDGQNSTHSAVTLTSSLGNWAAAKETIFQQARRSTIRFSQAHLEQDVLQIFLENPFDTEGYHHTFFDQWLRRDVWQTAMETGQEWSISPKAGVRYNQEFVGDHIRADLGHYSISGLDFLISLRNNNWNTASYSDLQTSCSFTPEDPTLTWDVLSLQHTQLSRFGSQIRSAYSAELKYNLWLAAQIGLGDYASHVAQLTATSGSGSPGSPPSVSDLSSPQQADNAYYRSLIESNSIRQYRSRTSSIAFAANAAALNDVLIVDRTGYWARNASGVPTARSFHSKIFITQDDGTCFTLIATKLAHLQFVQQRQPMPEWFFLQLTRISMTVMEAMMMELRKKINTVGARKVAYSVVPLLCMNQTQRPAITTQEGLPKIKAFRSLLTLSGIDLMG